MNKLKAVATASAAVLALAAPVVMTFEGLRTDPYRDPVGILTVCYGETHAPMRRYSPAECQDMLAASLAQHWQQIAACVPADAPDRVKAASASFAYNVGPAAFCGSSMSRKLLARDYAGGCAELSRWTYAGGQQLPGLVKRRAAERALCEGRA
ncbi:lysozyme [Roseateles sp.]|uniref:lysozyme n=1 Tax=Roseateles sp. TaxID=1971397 RepID=UPI0031DD8567